MVSKRMQEMFISLGKVFETIEQHENEQMTNTDEMRRLMLLVESPEAYHGTPHDVDRFSTDHIGSGEGVQAFGWGLYFSGEEVVAAHYRDNLTFDSDEENPVPERVLKIDGKVVSMKTPSNQLTAFERAATYWWLCHRDLEEAISDIEDSMRSLSPDGLAYKQYAEELEILKNITREELYSRVKITYGNFYKVHIIPENDYFLDWDKPLNKQPAPVSQALGKLGIKLTDDITGGTFYRQLATKLGSKKAASLKLLQVGIRGNRYFDQFSRRVGEGTYNYVVFDDNDVTILK